LIASDKVLTTASCAIERDLATTSGSAFRINPTTPTSGGEDIEIASVTVQTDYDPTTFSNDVAIVTLVSASSETPVGLNSKGAPATGSDTIAIGLGAVDDHYSASAVQEVTKVVQDLSQCQADYGFDQPGDGPYICALKMDGGVW
jgi:secreted trypsin-like serine protease